MDNTDTVVEEFDLDALTDAELDEVVGGAVIAARGTGLEVILP